MVQQSLWNLLPCVCVYCRLVGLQTVPWWGGGKREGLDSHSTSVALVETYCLVVPEPAAG
jgi:hypothetical protein